ncbi:SGNH/GDSL hydrolase family protein [Alkalinema sp. FACHB-956]|uniref:SGNH/GDSL hydrolase family protein n=1 Tax=Alkalinema sp. FACHB-956 TaxID=2692768 RepID=UPI001685E3A9|nr:SGNH/GDSL hydrolase family protein [Alkalinema sp. FACHB-956]MBD2327430.1 SGNH/GDSL hydrolase family protein [Alkalinema sp. FACHB-956]
MPQAPLASTDKSAVKDNYDFANFLSNYSSALSRRSRSTRWIKSLIHDLFDDRYLLAISPKNTLHRRQYDQIVAFGDSLTDTGNFSRDFSRAFGIPFPPSPPYAPGRLSNGALWVESLAKDLGITKVSNFAYIGATTGTQNVASLTLGQALPDIFPGIQQEVDTFQLSLAGQRANPNALYFVWGGANDYLFSLQSQFANAANDIVQGVTNIARSVMKLSDLGANTIAVANLPNLGRTPFATIRNISTESTLYSLAFNITLSFTLAKLDRYLKADIVELDTFSLGEAIAANPSKFGFTNITEPAIAKLPTINPDTYLFWDEFHPTQAFHNVIAKTFEHALSAPTPSRVLETSLNTAISLLNSSNGSALRSAFTTLLSSSSQRLSSINPLLASQSITPPSKLSLV